MAGVKGRSGGARVGSGPRRLSVDELRVRGSRVRGARRRDAVAPTRTVAGAPVPVPGDLPADQAAVWTALAPHATAAGTLTPGTALAFGDLCEAIVVKRLMLARIVGDGLTSDRVSLQMDEAGGGIQAVEPKAHPLLSKWTALMVRVEAGMARFRVTANGKPEEATDAPAVNPLDRFIHRNR